jgi:hypothetical protein
VARSMLGPQELPMAIHWEQVRLHWYQQQGNLSRVEDCKRRLERLEKMLWAT